MQSSHTENFACMALPCTPCSLRCVNLLCTCMQYIPVELQVLRCWRAAMNGLTRMSLLPFYGSGCIDLCSWIWDTRNQFPNTWTARSPFTLMKTRIEYLYVGAFDGQTSRSPI